MKPVRLPRKMNDLGGDKMSKQQKINHPFLDYKSVAVLLELRRWFQIGHLEQGFFFNKHVFIHFFIHS